MEIARKEESLETKLPGNAQDLLVGNLNISDSTLLAALRKGMKSSGVKVPPQTRQSISAAVASGAYKVGYKGGGGECFCVCGYCECKCG